MKKKNLPRADLAASLGFMVFAILVVVESLRMPTLQARSVPIYSAPGLVPGLLGCAMLLLAVALFVRSACVLRGAPESVAAADGERGTAGRLCFALVFCLLYALLLVGNLPYWLATGLFVFVFIVAFEWRLKPGTQQRLRMMASALLQAAVVSGIVTLVFEKLFLVRLP